MSEPELVELRSDDGLSSRGDKALFLTLFVAGLVLITWQKVFLHSLWSPILTGIGLIVTYCLVATKVRRFRIREDRVGEGAYYLGFLFTLVSLSVALYEFNQNQGGLDADANLISRFGLALGTTICGIVCRVVLQQLHETPGESETEVRESLSIAVIKLQSELQNSVEHFTLLKKRIEQETAEAIGTGMKQIIADNRSGLTQMAEEFQKQIAVALAGVSAVIVDTQAMATKSREVSARLFTAVDQLAERIDNSQSPVDVIRPGLEELTQTIKKAIAAENKRLEAHRLAVESLLETHKAIVGQASASVETMESAKSAAQGLAEVLSESAGALGSVLGNLKGLSELSAQSKTELTALVAATRQQVSDSQSALLQLQGQVVNAAETIVREVGGR